MLSYCIATVHILEDTETLEADEVPVVVVPAVIIVAVVEC